MSEPESKGKCLFCEKTFSKAGINRHLKTHLAKKGTENKPGTSFLLKVEPDPYYWIQAPYFLSLWINGDTKMKYLDDFLRAIWLECCGHLSAFTDPKKNKNNVKILPIMPPCPWLIPQGWACVPMKEAV